jgi:hypothetical protein
MRFFSTRPTIASASPRLAGLVAVAGLAAAFVSAPARADTVEIVPAPAARVPGTLPERGQSMASIEARFGAPASRAAAVGQPPITRWNYANFTVYFEYEHVIHAVAAASSQGDTTP